MQKITVLLVLLFVALIKTYCTLNVKYFPFDSQHCDIQFISWTHNGQQLDIFYNDSMNTAVYYASANQVSLHSPTAAFTARRYASAVCAMALCLCVPVRVSVSCVRVYHQSVFY